MSTTGTFSQRVNYAISRLRVGKTDSRGFDNCFEMYDGVCVVTKIVRRAREDAKLADAVINLFIERTSLEDTPWGKTAAKYEHLNDRRLSELSKILQKEGQFETYEVMLPGLHRNPDADFWKAVRLGGDDQMAVSSFRATSFEDACSFVNSWAHLRTVNGLPYLDQPIQIESPCGETRLFSESKIAA